MKRETNFYFTKPDIEGAHGLAVWRSRKKDVFYGLVDSEDVEKLKKYKWFVADKGYFKTRIGGRFTGVPEILFGQNSSMEYVFDHENGDKRDNRKANLQYMSFSTNVNNGRSRKSPVRGITLLPNGSWRIKDLYHGTSPTFKTLGEAVKAKMISLYKQGRTIDEIERHMDIRIGTKPELEAVLKKFCS